MDKLNKNLPNGTQNEWKVLDVWSTKDPKLNKLYLELDCGEPAHIEQISFIMKQYSSEPEITFKVYVTNIGVDKSSNLSKGVPSDAVQICEYKFANKFTGDSTFPIDEYEGDYQYVRFYFERLNQAFEFETFSVLGDIPHPWYISDGLPYKDIYPIMPEIDGMAYGIWMINDSLPFKLCFPNMPDFGEGANGVWLIKDSLPFKSCFPDMPGIEGSAYGIWFIDDYLPFKWCFPDMPRLDRYTERKRKIFPIKLQAYNSPIVIGGYSSKIIVDEL